MGAGAALLLWAMSSHYRAAPQGWEIRPTPDYLLTGGRWAAYDDYRAQVPRWLKLPVVRLPLIGYRMDRCHWLRSGDWVA